MLKNFVPNFGTTHVTWTLRRGHILVLDTCQDADMCPTLKSEVTIFFLNVFGLDTQGHSQKSGHSRVLTIRVRGVKSNSRILLKIR